MQRLSEREEVGFERESRAPTSCETWSSLSGADDLSHSLRARPPRRKWRRIRCVQEFRQ